MIFVHPKRIAAKLCQAYWLARARFVPHIGDSGDKCASSPPSAIVEECRTIRHTKKESTMTKGLKGEKCPTDLVGMSVMVAQIATGEIHDNKKWGRFQSGMAGAKARAQNLTLEKRSEIARKAAHARWE